MANKWDCKTTIKFIELYKLHPCLWNFKSSDYKNKQKRDAAYRSILQEMNIPRFGVQDAKNKIKNLRSTYSQEMKKVRDSKKSGTGLSKVYTPNIKWLKEIEDVFKNDLKRKTCENTNIATNEEACAQPSGSSDDKEVGRNTTTMISTVPVTTSNTPIIKKRRKDIVKAISDLKSLHKEVNTEETSFDYFGKTVAMQLKSLSTENALLAQSKIQTVLTEFGIKDYREKIASSHRPSSAISIISSDTNQSFSEFTAPPICHYDDSQDSTILEDKNDFNSSND